MNRTIILLRNEPAVLTFESRLCLVRLDYMNQYMFNVQSISVEGTIHTYGNSQIRAIRGNWIFLIKLYSKIV